VVAVVVAAPAFAQPGLAAPYVIDGPSPDIASLQGMSIARDGTGGVAYLKRIGGVAHVFVSRLGGGVFRAPQQVDLGLPGATSHPVIAATPGGGLFVAFINGGGLYVTQALDNGGWSGPQGLYTNADSPSIAMASGVGYLAFTADAGSGTDVLTEYYDGDSWQLASPSAMNVNPGDDAGAGAGRPQVAAAGDGIGIVTWGENGHVYSRRVWGTGTSVQYAQLDPSTWSGWNETSADSPSISVGGDSSYVGVTFRETLASGSATQSRVLMTRQVAESVAPTVATDGLTTPGGANATQPAIALNEYGRGFATAVTDSNQVIGTPLGTNGAPAQPEQINTAADPVNPYAVPALAGLSSTFIAWQGGASEIDLRFAQDGSHLGSTMVASSPSVGPTQAADGLAGDGDNEGDAAVAWVQGTPGMLSIDAAQLYQPPHVARPTIKLVYARRPQPVLTWSPSLSDWGGISYTVTLDGVAIAHTTGNSALVPTPLIDGPHVWQVTTANPSGLTSTSPAATVFVDTTPPNLRIQLSGKSILGDRLTLALHHVDLPDPLQSGARASGVKSLSIGWGDRSPTLTGSRRTSSRHVYAKTGRYRITIRLTDRAGNTTTIVRRVRIVPKPRPKHRKHRKPGKNGAAHA
jgi:hypothetical protein